MPPRSHEAVKDIINLLHDTYGLSWWQMAGFVGVPGGTLWDIAHGKPVPSKWKNKWNVYRDLFAMPVAELRWALENREEMRQ